KKSILLLLTLCTALLGFASVFFSAFFPTMKKGHAEPAMFHLPPGNPYTADWARVDSLEGLGLPESARQAVVQILHRAQKDGNQPQLFKCMVYMMKYTESVEEEALVKNVEYLHRMVDSVGFPLKPVVHSALAQQYHAYFQQNSWRLYDRTATQGVHEEDLRTWDRRKLIQAAARHYRLSLHSPDSLRRVNLEYFDDILVKQPKSRTYRPSLYDLLAWRAFDFFQDDEMGIDEPAYKFQLEGDDFFKDEEGFMAARWATRDSTSHLLAAAQILQELTRQHRGDKDPSARIFVARDRLAFGKRKAISDLKDSLYLRALENLEAQTRDHAASAYLLYDIASQHHAHGAQYDGAASQEHKTAHAEALKYCEQALLRFPGADGTILCQNLQLDILARSMELTLEQVNDPDRPFLGSLEYRNVERVWLRAIKASTTIKNNMEGVEPEKWVEKLSREPAVKEWNLALPADRDYNLHRVQLPMPALPIGEYVILVSSHPDFKVKGEGLAYAVLHVSRIGFAERSLKDGSVEFVLFDRNTGEPLAGAEAQSMQRYYDYDKRKYVRRDGAKHTTDKNGFFILRTAADYRSVSMEFRYQDDFLSTDDQWHLGQNQEHPRATERKTFFFLDRGIYRPGQTIYFKGITVETDGEKSQIVQDLTSEVEFYDANHQKVASLNLTTNEFGSFQGSFTAPQGQLNGQMHIENAHGSAYFSVEDYKRPQFEVAFEPVKGSFRLGDPVKVKGKAVAYAGSNIDGAEVRYRVLRTVSFPWWHYWCWGRILPPSRSMEITSGVSSTNEMGEFEVEFTAIPDRSLSADLKPQFNYQVQVDVVDITGETHSAKGNVSVGYLALKAEVPMGDALTKGDRNRFKIVTTNLNGQPEPARGTITIHRLRQPDRIYRSRLWPAPDKFLLSEAEFHSQFPHDLYKDELEMRNWAREKEVFSEEFDSEKNDTLDLQQCKKWNQGQYVLELRTRDKFGSEIKSISYFSLSGDAEAGIPTMDQFWYRPGKLTCEPGQAADFTVGTALEEAWLLYETEHKSETVTREWIRLRKGKRKFMLPVEEKHRGNFGAHLLMVRNGRISHVSPAILVPWTNRTLGIEYASFRDKLLPGANEEWTIKVKGPDGERVAAELLAGMYDASLDAFRGNQWSIDLNPIHFNRLNWREYNGSATRHSQLVSTAWNPPGRIFAQNFDAINWFGYSIDYPGYGLYGSVQMEDAVDAMPMPRKAMRGNSREKMEMSATEAFRMVDETPEAEEKKPDGQGGVDHGTDMAAGGKDATLGEVKVRTNLNETAFFYPQLRTDDQGNVVFKFTMPEALTKWRFMTLAHTADLKTGYRDGTVVTQKELMVMPNAPRFLRENDQITYMAKVSNLSDKDLTGQATLELFDALTMKPIDLELGNGQKLQQFSVQKGRSTVLRWPLKIPPGIQAVTHRVKAAAGSFSDGEESAVPVLTNAMLVTEALPLPVRPLQTESFRFSRLIDSKSSTLRSHKLTLEFTSNPAWYAVQALPYMMEYPYECMEQTFSRFYANSLASHLANKHPRIRQVFEAWKTAGKEALLSNLEKNQELKYLLLEETPWVMNAQDERERKQRVGLLFDLNRMGDALERAKRKLVQGQVSNGGFTWFPGMPESRYITQHIVCGFGHLDHLGITGVRADGEVWNMLEKAVRYLDLRIREDYERLLRDKVDMKQQQIGWDEIHYLYARSYIKEIGLPSGSEAAVSYYIGQARQYWTRFNKYHQGMIALALHRGGDPATPPAILRSLRESALKSEEMGMYWKADGDGMHWYQAPIETQALLIEAFDEVA
ncbi:MAG: hypothetical protein RLZZ165_975, partial [Bacteroidota bacterium]